MLERSESLGLARLCVSTGDLERPLRERRGLRAVSPNALPAQCDTAAARGALGTHPATCQSDGAKGVVRLCALRLEITRKADCARPAGSSPGRHPPYSGPVAGAMGRAA